MVIHPLTMGDTVEFPNNGHIAWYRHFIFYREVALSLEVNGNLSVYKG